MVKVVKMKKFLCVLLAVILCCCAFVGCKTNEEPDDTGVNWGDIPGGEDSTDDEEEYTGPKTTLTVLTNRVDLVNTTLVEYKNRFEDEFPQYNIVWQAFNDYDKTVSTRLPSGDYGDVCLIPATVSKKTLPTYFTVLSNNLEQMQGLYRYADIKAYNGNVYGLPTYGNANGILYNKKVFREAGVTELPSTYDEFYAAMGKIKNHYANDSSFLAPYYTNFKDSWALEQWSGAITGVAGDPDYYYSVLPSDRTAFTEGPVYKVHELLYELVRRGYTEAAPASTDWERSKVEFCRGNIGTMLMGSWAVSQIVGIAQDLVEGNAHKDDGSWVESVPGDEHIDPADIGYMPFPYTHEDGKIYSAHSPDYFWAVNRNTTNEKKTGGFIFIKWMIEKSGYYVLCGGIPPKLEMEFPDLIKGFEDLGVVLLPENAATGDLAGKLELVESRSGVVLWSSDWKNAIVEEAFKIRQGESGFSYAEIMANVNEDWLYGIDAVM